jgi:hypothetical protein
MQASAPRRPAYFPAAHRTCACRSTGPVPTDPGGAQNPELRTPNFSGAMAAPNIPPEVVRTILTPIVLSERGASFLDIVTAFPNPPPPDQVRLWLDELIATDLIEALSSGEGLRYYALEAAGPYWHTPLVVPTSSGASLPAPSNVASPVVDAGSVEAGPSVSADAEFATLFDRNVVTIVCGLMPQASAMAVFRLIAQSSLSDGERQRAFVRYGLDRLSQLTMGECVRYGMEPEQYAMWRRTYSPPSSQSGSNTAQPVARDGQNAVVEPVAERPKTRRARRSAGSREGREVAEWLTGGGLSSGSTTSRGGADAFPKASASGFARLLIEGLERLFPGLDPVLKRVLIGAASVLIVGALSLASGSLRVLGVLAVVFIAGAIVLARARSGVNAGAAPSSNPALKGAGASPKTDSERRRWTPRTWYLIGTGCIAAIVLVLGWSWYRESQETPTDAAVRACLVTTLAPLPVQVPQVDVTPLQVGKTGCTLSFQAQVVLAESLYRRENTAEYLRTHFGNEMAVINAANALFAGPNGARLRTAVSVPRPPLSLAGGDATSPSRNAEDPATGRSQLQVGSSAAPNTDAGIVLLTTETPAGTEVLANGTLRGMRHGSDWTFDASGWYSRPRFSGERKPPGVAVFAVDNGADMARLKALVADEVAYATAAQAAAMALAAELERDRQKRVDGFAQLLRSGTLFTGTIADSTADMPLRVVVELVDTSATTYRVSALVRNDGGWSDARAFHGEWTVDADAEVCSLTLDSRIDELVSKAGPLLEDYGRRSVGLRIRADGSAVGVPGNSPFTRVDAAAAAAVKAELMRPIVGALAATKPGLVYRGTATAKQRNEPETLILRFTEQDPDGVTVRATLESATNAGWVRPFRGTIIGNTYRAGMNPIRLGSADNERVSQADTKSPLGVYTGTSSFTVALRVEGKGLVGEDERFRYSFDVADPATSQRSESSGQRSDSNDTAGRSLPAAPIPSSPPLDRASVQPLDGPSVQPLDRPSAPSTPAATSAPVDASSPEFQRISLSAFPNLPAPLPAQQGAYVRIGAGWVPLPQNHSYVVRSTARGLAGIVSKVQHVQDAVSGQTSANAAPIFGNLTLDGRNNVPVVPGEDVVIVYIGPLTPLTAEQLARNPELQAYPVMELAPLKIDQRGDRYTPLYEIAPGVIAFGGGRVPATIENGEAAALIFRCTGKLASGRYALSCGPKFYEVMVR